MQNHFFFRFWFVKKLMTKNTKVYFDFVVENFLSRGFKVVKFLLQKYVINISYFGDTIFVNIIYVNKFLKEKSFWHPCCVIWIVEWMFIILIRVLKSHFGYQQDLSF